MSPKKILLNIKRIILMPSILMGIFTGCSMFNPIPAPTIHKFEINYSKNDKPQECSNHSNNNVLQIMPVQANAPYNTVKMFYSKQEYELDHYSYNQWVALPQDMINQAVEQKLIQSCVYANVINNAFMANATLRLSVQLIELKQNIQANSSMVSLTTLVQLIDNTTNQVIKSKTFLNSITESADPQGFVIGANKVTNLFIADLISWLR